MKKTISGILVALLLSAFVGACGGSSGGGAPPPPPPPPPPADQNPAGIWTGQAVTPDIPDVTTSFEFSDSDGFIIGTAPFTADFQGGVAETRGIGALYANGVFSWHVGATDGTIEFATPGSTLSFSTRTVTVGDAAIIQVLDENGVEISNDIVPDAFAAINVTRDPAIGESLIGSVVITVETGEIVIDPFTLGYPSTASTDDIACLIAPDDEIVCVVSDATTGDLIAGANGTVSVASSQVSGMGWLYAVPGASFADGSTIAALTISAGTVAENTSLDLTIDGTGVSIAVTAAFDASFSRGSDLVTVEASWMNFDIFGDPSSFDVDATGAISGTSAAGCMLMGQVSVVDATVNAYDVALTVTDGGTCGIAAGDYNGLGATADDTVTDDQFPFAVFVDGISMIIGAPTKP